MLFDTHAHLNDEMFDIDRETVIHELRNKQISVLNCGYDEHSSVMAVRLAEENEFFYAAAGLHPESSFLYTDEFEDVLTELLKNNKTVALGEIGLDYHYEGFDKASQKIAFERQLILADTNKKPVSIHSRDAAGDTYEIIKACCNPNFGGVMHSFNQSRELMKKYIDLNFYFGISGPVTFKNAANLKELVSYIPSDRLLIETDSPYLTPVPYRGKRNTPAYVEHVARQIAQIRNRTYEEICEQTYNNALTLFLS